MLASPTDQQKVTHVIGLLTWRALTWATAIWEKRGKNITNYKRFISLFKRIVDHLPDNKKVGKRLLSLTPGTDSCGKCIRLSHASGKHSNVLTEMACHDDETSLDVVIDLAIRLDNILL